MNPIRTSFFILFLIFPFPGSSQSIVGKWTTIDDASGEIKSIVEITERDQKFYGRILKIFPKESDDADPVCDKCPDDDSRYNKKIIGMEILKDMVLADNEYTRGSILDPEVGKIYRCKLWIEDNNLKVRGYWGPFFRTQTWKRI